jgi:hypothetical protein
MVIWANPWGDKKDKTIKSENDFVVWLLAFRLASIRPVEVFSFDAAEPIFFANGFPTSVFEAATKPRQFSGLPLDQKRLHRSLDIPNIE